MERKQTLIRVSEGLRLTLSPEHEFKEIYVGRKRFSCYQFKLYASYHNKDFVWTIRRRYSAFRALFDRLRKVCNTLNTSLISTLPFKLKPRNEKLDHLYKVLESLVAELPGNPVFFEFLEISANSFLTDKKFKEGYLMKVGSGRKVNQARCCASCYATCQRNRRRWVRVSDRGIEYLPSHIASAASDVVYFSFNFRVRGGKAETGTKNGILVESDQHRVLFKSSSALECEEFVSAINNAFAESEYGSHQGWFSSSFIFRPQNTCKWYIDGECYYRDVYKALAGARRYVYITDWWMSPEHYLQRPAEEYPETQLIEVLGQLADRQVRVYVSLYKELTFSLTLDSLHTKQALQARSEYIRVLRHPNISFRGSVFLWSHHEKMVVVDGEVGFLGGLDLCHGRYDSPSHHLTDVEQPYIWGGIDYSNVRIADFQNVKNWTESNIDRHQFPRMPWHDVAMRIQGNAVHDLELHFRELWNHIIRDITGSNSHECIIPLHSSQLVKSERIDLTKDTMEVVDEHNRELKKSMQQFRAQDIATPVENPRESSNLASFIPLFTGLVRQALGPERIQMNEQAKLALLEEKQIEEEKEAKALPQVVQQGLIHLIKDKLALSQEVVGGTCQCQLLRSGGLWSIGRPEAEQSIHTAYLTVIEQAEHFIYIENQFFISSTAGSPVCNRIVEALKNRILRASREGTPFKVIVMIPLLPGFEGAVDDSTAAVLRVQLHYEYMTICRGRTSLLSQLSKQIEDPSEYVQFYGLRNHAKLGDLPVTEMIYIHSKMIIVDDRIVIMGSANLNDRSMLGDRDSELALYVEDKESVEITMAGRPFKANNFAHSLRMSLFLEHSGETCPDALVDPLCEEFDRVWRRRARKNTRFYRDVFRCYPDDNITKISQLDSFTEQANLDLYDERKTEVVGHLVKLPLDFLCEEDLRLRVVNREYFLPDTTFT